ncbi:MAG: hypothetical protein CMA31_02060 [Euryarchaeota archaeon]|nr:hypothetical protein [Euryarchaeota archaeon]|tara:strand:- start:386 stop:1126 length:741 start_codon:yes stop_codon:yes gene_type:complete
MADSRELQAFRFGIALTEGGGKIDYEQGNSESGAYGAYQFVPKWWDWYSTQAGYPGADIKDPAVQDAVAKYWFNKNYNDLGSWELAAVAHFAGRTTAFKAKENGFDSIKNIKDSTGTTIEQYVNKTMQNYNEQMQMMSKVDEDVGALNLPDFGAGFGGSYDATEIVNKEAATVLDAISTGMSNGGRKKLPISTQSDFERQVPSQAGSFEATQIKSNIAGQATDQVNQYAQTVEQAFQQYLDAVNNG